MTHRATLDNEEGLGGAGFQLETRNLRLETFQSRREATSVQNMSACGRGDPSMKAFDGEMVQNRVDRSPDDVLFGSHEEECAHQVYYKFIIDSLPLAVVTMDSEFRITGFNPWAEKLTGFSAEEAMGRNCQDILHSTLCGRECPLRAIQNPENHSVSSRAGITSRDGSVTPVRISAAALFDGWGQRIGGVEAIVDLSAVVAMERLRANFIAMLAHDMRSSLTGIHGLGLRLLRNPPDMNEAKARRHLEIIAREAGKLESLVDDFLEFSRIETGGVKLNMTAVSLDRELEEIFETYRERAEQRGLRLELEVSDILPVIEADANRLRRVLRISSTMPSSSRRKAASSSVLRKKKMKS
jgi:PAS domain S-box-containing protein